MFFFSVHDVFVSEYVLVFCVLYRMSKGFNPSEIVSEQLKTERAGKIGETGERG